MKKVKARNFTRNFSKHKSDYCVVLEKNGIVGYWLTPEDMDFFTNDGLAVCGFCQDKTDEWEEVMITDIDGKEHEVNACADCLIRLPKEVRHPIDSVIK